MLESACFTLNHSGVIDSENFFINTTMNTIFSTQFKANWDNRKYYIYGYGDSVIADGALKIDGDVTVSCGWGDGISFKRVFNGGFIKEMHYVLYPQNNRQYYPSLAIDKTRHIAYLGNHDYDNLRVYDYSGLINDYLTESPLLFWEGSEIVPTNTTSLNGTKWNFSGVPNGTKNIEIRVLGKDFEGGMYLSVNGVELGMMNQGDYHVTDNSEVWFIYHTDSFNLSEEGNEISIWSTSTDGGATLQLEVYALGNSLEVIDLGSYTEADNDLPCDEVGKAYSNGLAVAGDYLYLVPDGKSWEGKMWRWNTVTQTKEELEVVNLNKTYTRYGRIIYSEETDRIYIQWKYDSELWVTLNASSPTEAKTYCVRIEAAGFGDDNYCGGVVEDKENPNLLTIWSEYYLGIIDITACITEPVTTGVAPTVIQKSEYTYNAPYYLMSEDMRIGENLHPEYKSDLISLYGRGAWGRVNGWYDKENNKLVMPIKYNGASVTHYSNEPLYGDYNSSPVLAELSNGEKYWIQAGYGGNMSGRLIIHDYDKGIVLEEKSHITFGPYSLDTNNNIGSAQCLGILEQLYIPSECNATFYLSNNNGDSWETYDIGSVHFFNSTGSQVLLKIIFDGTPVKAPYIFGLDVPVLIIHEKQNNLISVKKTSIKLGGAK